MICLLLVVALLHACGTGPAIRGQSSQNTYTNIADGEADIDVNSAVSLTFTLAVSTSSVNTSTFYIVPSVAVVASINSSDSLTKSAINTAVCNLSNAISGTITASSSASCNTSFTLTPDSSLDYETEYTICATDGITLCNPNVGGFFTGFSETFTTVADASTYTVGGTTTGLDGTVVLQNNEADDLTLTEDGAFTFTTAITDTAAYDVTVKTNPDSQTCTASDNSGNIDGANVTNVSVVCSINAYTVGGTVTGLSGTVVLQNNGGDNLTITSDGSFTFETEIADGAGYAVTVLTHPNLQICTVSSGTGTMSGANITDVSVGCSNESMSAPTATAIRVTLGANNAYGMSVGLTAGDITMPACTPSYPGMTISYTIPDLPSWLSFDSSTRAVTLTSGSTFPTDALTASAVTYTCADADNSTINDSTALTINDLDGGGAVDGHEYINGALPMLSNSFGWATLNVANVGTYRTSTIARVPTGVIKPTVGMDPTDVDDDIEDFDGDDGVSGGGTNAEETTAGTNPMVYATDGTFGAKDTYTAGGVPTVITMADFNGDGYPDMAVTPNFDRDVSIFIGDGDGTFAAKVNYRVGNAPFGVTAADFDDDGIIDLASANSSDDDISVLLGDGDGTFAAKTDYASADMPHGIISADFNGDNDVDLATTNYGDDSVSILLGNGDGTFAAKSDYPVGSDPNSLVSGDFNGDGNLDIISMNQDDNTISVLIGVGDGTFDAKVDYETDQVPFNISAADFNNDGNLDIITANLVGGNVSIFLGVGDGTFAEKVDSTTGIGPMSVVAADFNGDGNIDIAVGNFPVASFVVRLGNGDGTFDAETSYTTADDYVSYITAADMDDDGDLDIAVTDCGGFPGQTISVFLNE